MLYKPLLCILYTTPMYSNSMYHSYIFKLYIPLLYNLIVPPPCILILYNTPTYSYIIYNIPSSNSNNGILGSSSSIRVRACASETGPLPGSRPAISRAYKRERIDHFVQLSFSIAIDMKVPGPTGRTLAPVTLLPMNRYNGAYH